MRPLGELANLNTSAAEASFKPVTSKLLNFLRSGGAPPIDAKKMELAKVAARLIFGQIRKDDTADPDTFFTAAALALTSYEPEVIAYVVDPRTGVARHGTWVPSIKELHDACVARSVELAALRRYRETPEPASASPASALLLEQEVAAKKLKYETILAKARAVKESEGLKAVRHFATTKEASFDSLGQIELSHICEWPLPKWGIR